MKRKIKIFAVIICGLLMLLLTTTAFAYFEDDGEYKEQYDELLYQSGAKDLFSLIPDDAEGLITENQLDSIEPESFINISFFDIVGSIYNAVKSAIKSPIALLASAIGIILLYALLSSLKTTFEDYSYEKVFSVISAICICSVIVLPISRLILRVAALIEQVSRFLLSFVPVYVGIITASGKPISATAYQATVVGVVEVLSRICATVFVPMLGIYLAFCLVGSICGEIDIYGIAKAVKNTVITALTFMLTIFTGLLTIQGVVAGSADTLTMRTTKFAVSSFLPVVGTCVSEALNSVHGSIGLIKSTVGGFGIVAIVAAFLPSIIEILLIQLSLYLACGVSECFKANQISSLLRSAESVLSLIFGILIVFLILLIISIGIMLTAGG